MLISDSIDNIFSNFSNFSNYSATEKLRNKLINIVKVNTKSFVKFVWLNAFNAL